MVNEWRDTWELCGGKTPKQWNFTTIESLLEDSKNALAVGVMYPGKNTVDGVPLIKISDVKNGRVTGTPDFLISPQKDDEYKRTRLFGNELLITLVGNPGDCVLVTEDMANWNIARAIAVLRLKDKKLRKWVRLALLSHPAQQFMSSRFNTTVQRTLNLKDIREIVLPIPPTEVRQGITELISAMDDKIELNRRMNETLESMVQALFKSWFVDFDPVIDNALAAGNPIPEPLRARAETRGALGAQRKSLPDEIQKLFPDAFVFDDEMGWIPEGWEVDSIKNRASAIQYGFTQSSSEEIVGPHFLRITDIRGGQVNWPDVPFCEVTESELDKYRILDGDVFVARTGASTGENTYVVEPPNAVFASYLVRFQFDSRGVARFVGQFMRSPRYFNHVQGILGGSAQPNASAQTLASAVTVFPSESVADAFIYDVRTFDLKRSSNQRKSEILTKLRDTLLPKLLSGELRIPDAEKLVADGL